MSDWRKGKRQKQHFGPSSRWPLNRNMALRRRKALKPLPSSIKEITNHKHINGEVWCLNFPRWKHSVVNLNRSSWIGGHRNHVGINIHPACRKDRGKSRVIIRLALRNVAAGGTWGNCLEGHYTLCYRGYILNFAKSRFFYNHGYVVSGYIQFYRTCRHTCRDNL